MTVPLGHLFGWLIAAFRSREELVLENLALPQQLFALHTKRRRPRFGILDKLFGLFCDESGQVGEDQ